jgi:uncharacterized membrane protein
MCAVSGAHIHETNRKMGAQIGQFLLFIGGILLILFGATVAARGAYWLFCLSGFPLTVMGLYLLWRNRTEPPEETARFRSIRGKNKSSAPQKGKSK